MSKVEVKSETKEGENGGNNGTKLKLKRTPIVALRNLEPYDCFAEYADSRVSEIKHAGDCEFLADYVNKIINWYRRIYRRPEMKPYDIPALEFPSYVEFFYQAAKDIDNLTNNLRFAKEIHRRFLRPGPPPKRSSEHFDHVDRFHKYEKNIANRRQELAKNVPLIREEADISSMEENQYLVYYRAVNVWRAIQVQAMQRGDVRIRHRNGGFGDGENGAGFDPLDIFPLDGYSELIVETPPLPVVPTYQRLMKDIAEMRKVMSNARDENGAEMEHKTDAELVVAPTSRHSYFNYPFKYKRKRRSSS